MIASIIEGARIYDGVAPDPITTDLAIVGDRIALIGDLSGRDAYERIDGRDLALAPGFIDVHSHTDELWLADGRCVGKIRQGVTTEIGGNCGTSCAPLRGSTAQWQHLDEFFAAVERGGVALNVATLVGLGTTRRIVAGERDGRLEAHELRAECDLVRDTIERGALGVSSGLIYVPSRYADSTELIACARTAREAGAARYVSHIRDEGDELLEAVEEALDIGRLAEVAVQLSHHKAARKKNWGKVHRSLDAIARARARGENAGADVYPYVAMCTDLDTILPNDATEGGSDATLERLADPEAAAALALRLKLDREETEWHDILISTVGSERNAELAGMRLDEIARMWRLSPPRAALRLLAEERLDVTAIFFAMNEDDVATVISADFVTIGSDASARAVDGPTAQGLPHPRTFGCFPRVFGRYVRGRRTLEIGEAIRRMTSLAADTFGIAERGRIVPGAFADLVLFDPERIVDTATYARPYSYPLGIDSVWGERPSRGASRRNDGRPARARIARRQMNVNALGAERRDALLADARRRSVVRGDFIYTPGDLADCVYVVDSGRVKIVRTSANGAESIVGIRNPGDIFGELSWMTEGARRSTSAIVLDPGDVCRVDAVSFDRRLRADAETAAYFARGVGQRLSSLERELTELAGKSVPGRLVDVLGRLAAEHGLPEDDGTLRIGLSLTHKDLADLIGTSRETLTKELSVLADVGLLRVAHRTIVLLQPQAFPFARRREPV